MLLKLEPQPVILVVTESWILVPPKSEPQPMVLPGLRCMGFGLWSQGYRTVGTGPTEARVETSGLTGSRPMGTGLSGGRPWLLFLLKPETQLVVLLVQGMILVCGLVRAMATTSRSLEPQLWLLALLGMNHSSTKTDGTRVQNPEPADGPKGCQGD